MSDPVVIVDHDPAWAARFEVAAARYREALASVEFAFSVHHIGSTSVPGLASKDRVDLQLTLPGEDAVPAFQAALVAAGMAPADPNRDHRPPGDESPERDWQKLYHRGHDLPFAANVHVRFAGRRNREYPLLFRDYLRAHPASAAAYGHFKRGLAAAVGTDRDLYCDLKDPVCDLIMVEARGWALREGWRAPA